jgi:FKBP-type peptidyl-prolyl cis-trans isomerase FkpA
MKISKPGLAVGLILISAWLFSCKHANEQRSESGMKYILYTKNPGPKAKQGDYVTIEMVYKTDNDSILFDSGKNKMPLRFQLGKSPFAGSMEEGLTLLAQGDSATFFVSADSLVQKVFSKRVPGNYSRPSFLKSGSFLKYDIRLLRIQGELDAAQEIYRELDRRSALEQAGIKKYIQDHNVTQQPDSTGIYIIKNIQGKGPVINNGKTVIVNYNGKFLNGESFGSNEKFGKPFSFTLGRGEAFKGWDVAFKKLRQGDKATLLIPSRQAYGEEGLRNKTNGTYIIKPNTPLLFEVEIVGVK